MVLDLSHIEGHGLKRGELGGGGDPKISRLSHSDAARNIQTAAAGPTYRTKKDIFFRLQNIDPLLPPASPFPAGQ